MNHFIPDHTIAVEKAVRQSHFGRIQGVPTTLERSGKADRWPLRVDCDGSGRDGHDLQLLSSVNPKEQKHHDRSSAYRRRCNIDQ